MRISSYSFILILLKLHRCFGHGLKICMWFGYNPQIIFYHFFCYFNLGIFLAFNNGGGHKFSEFACFNNNCVRSISLVLFEIGIPNVLCECILGWWSVLSHLQVTVTLTSGLVFRKIMSREYLL